MTDACVPAGFPSPAEDMPLDLVTLERLLITNREATFFLRVSGDSMRDAQINDGDIIAVDKSLYPKDGDIVVAHLEGEFTLKRLRLQNGQPWLEAANPAYPRLTFSDLQELRIWGVATFAIHDLRS